MFTPQVVKPPTSADVAAAAGVSRATVSFVLNDKPNSRIPEDTRRRVLEAAHQLGYSPNPTARSLATSAVSGTVIATGPSDYGVGLRRAVDLWVQELLDDGGEVMVDAGVETTGVEAATLWARMRPERMLVAAERCDGAATEVLRQAGVRALLVYGDQAVDHAPLLSLSQCGYGSLAARHLLAFGHRSLCYLIPARSSQQALAAARVAGAQGAVEAAGGRLTRVIASADSASLRDWAHGWRFQADPPTGVLAFDDGLAIAAIRALVDAGVRVPEEVSVIGADDHPVGRDFIPRLTTVAFDAGRLAQDIGDAYTRMVGGTRVERVPTPPLRLIERE
ncbi:MAG: LacI family DNA-binding transcriptional regulator, partial [Candidatus Dormibacteraceae bacterium]